MKLQNISYYANNKQSTQEMWVRLNSISLQNTKKQMIIMGDNNNDESQFLTYYQDNPNNDSTNYSTKILYKLKYL